MSSRFKQDARWAIIYRGIVVTFRKFDVPECSDEQLAHSVVTRPAPASHEICKPARRPAATPSPMPFDGVCPTLGRVATRVTNRLASRIHKNELV
jgi:hypothetical protein